MIRHPHIGMAFTFALIASTACISVKAIAQQAAPDQQSQRQESPTATTATPDPAEQTARGRLADAKAVLKLSTEQEKLWSPVEDAVRNLQERTRDLRSSFSDVRPNDQIERLRRLSELSTQRGDALKRLADAVQPLWATLSDEQKRDLPRFVGVAAERTDQDRMMGRGRNSSDDRSVGRQRYGGGWRDDDRHYGEDSRHGSSDDGRRQGRDDVQGLRDRDDDQRRDRVDGYSRWGSQDQDDVRPRSREWDRNRRGFDRRSERDRCRCYDRD